MQINTLSENIFFPHYFDDFNYVKASRSMLEMHSRPTHLQTTNTRSNAYWLQHDVQHYRMKYAVKKLSNSHQKGCSKKYAFKMDSDTQVSIL